MTDHLLMKEPPAWLNAKIDQRLAAFDAIMGDLTVLLAKVTGAGIVVTGLTEPEPGQDIKVWDETCDCCGTHVPGELHDGLVKREHRGLTWEIFYGVCPSCLEGMRRDAERES